MKNTARQVRTGSGILLASLILLLGLSGPAQGRFWQPQQQPPNQSRNAVRIPDLGTNPWAVDSILGGRKALSGGLDGKDMSLRAEMLKNWVEQKKASLDPEQKRMLENLMKNVGNGKNIDREQLNRMLEKLFPDGNSAAREQLKNLLGNGEFGSGAGKSLAEPGKQGEKAESGGNFDAPTAGQGGNGGPGQGPGQGAGAEPEVEPGSSKEFGSKGEQNKPLPVPPITKGGAGQTTPAVPTPTGADKALKSLLPLGLEKWAKPAANNLMEWTAKWSRDFKLPKGWGEEIKKSLGQIRLPQSTSMPTAPRLPSSPSISLPRPEFLVFFVMGGVALGMLIWLALKKVGLGSAGGLLAAFRTTGKGDNLIGALESAVLRLGGDKVAIENHILWKNDYATVMAQKGLAPEAVERIFDQYVWMKYRGLPLDRQTESQAIAALHRI